MSQEIRARNLDKKITNVIGYDPKGLIYGPLIAQDIGAVFVSLFLKLRVFERIR